MRRRDLEEGSNKLPNTQSSRLARATVDRVLPAGAVWKDPRRLPVDAILAANNRSALSGIAHIAGRPSEVAGSLGKRNELPSVLGLALWARYNRYALRGLEGRRVLVLSYEGLLGNPKLYAAEVVSF